MQEEYFEYSLVEVRVETNEVSTLFFIPKQKRLSIHKAGQYTTLYFQGELDGHGKSYTISSSPKDSLLSITVKKMGSFSERLHSLKVGDSIILTPPEGYFFPEDDQKKLVFLAGGIGITPFYSILRSWPSGKFDDHKVSLFYSNLRESETVFLKELRALFSKKGPSIMVNAFTGVKESTLANSETRRIDIDMLRDYLGDEYTNSDYFICGPTEFVDSIWQQIKVEIDEDNIFTEAYYI